MLSIDLKDLKLTNTFFSAILVRKSKRNITGYFSVLRSRLEQLKVNYVYPQNGQMILGSGWMSARSMMVDFLTCLLYTSPSPRD